MAARPRRLPASVVLPVHLCSNAGCNVHRLALADPFAFAPQQALVQCISKTILPSDWECRASLDGTKGTKGGQGAQASSLKPESTKTACYSCSQSPVSRAGQTDFDEQKNAIAPSQMLSAAPAFVSENKNIWLACQINSKHAIYLLTISVWRSKLFM